MSKKKEEELELDSNMVSDVVSSLLDPIEARKERPKTKKQLEEDKYKRELRKAAAGKVAGWGDYKFDWED